MDDKVRINIQVGENRHPLFVSRDEEPIFRDAARMVNERINAYATKYRGAGLPQEYMMAFAAIDIASQYVRLNHDNNAKDAGQRLQNLADEIRKYMQKD